MNFVDKISGTLLQSIDYIIDKNRRCAQLNRLDVIIQNETEILNNAYIALGKIYLKKLEENGEETQAETEQIINLIQDSKIRLKKARARYNYTSKYGVPKPGFNENDVVNEEQDSADIDEIDAETINEEIDDEDITIAYAEPEAEKAEKTEETDSAKEVPDSDAVINEETKAEAEPPAVSEKKTDSAASLKKKRSSSKKKTVVRESDSEAANDSDNDPIV